MAEPLVSIIMPVYNAAPFVAASVASMLNQTYPNLELIAVNDGSTDESARVLDELAAGDSRLRVLHQQNAGVSAAMATGLAAARGDFIARMDADDTCPDYRITEQMRLMLADDEVVLVSGRYQFFDLDGNFLEELALPMRDRDIRLDMNERCPICSAASLMRRSALEAARGYNPEYRVAEDFELWTRLIKLGKFAMVPKVIYRYQLNPDGLSQQLSGEQQQNALSVLQRYWAENPPEIVPLSYLLDIRRFYLDDWARPFVPHIYRVIRLTAERMWTAGRRRDAVKQLLALSVVDRESRGVLWQKLRNR